MIFPKEIDNQIIQLCAEHWELTVRELFSYLWNSISLPNLYKKIQNFLSLHILSKDKNKLSLNKKWILSYLNFANQLSDRYEKEHPHLQSLETAISYTSNSLYSLDPIRASLLSELNMLYKYKETNYIYHPHTYYMYGMKNEDTITFSNIWLRWTEILYMIWNQTGLDAEWVKIIQELPNTQVVMRDKHKFLNEWYCFNIVWDHVIEVFLPRIVSDYFELIFNSTKDINKFDLNKIKNAFHVKAPVKLTLKKDSEKCDNFKKLIQNEFKKHVWNVKK